MLITNSAPHPHTKNTPTGGNKNVNIITQQSITIFFFFEKRCKGEKRKYPKKISYLNRKKIRYFNFASFSIKNELACFGKFAWKVFGQFKYVIQ
jgi:hypothetical protein